MDHQAQAHLESAAIVIPPRAWDIWDHAEVLANADALIIRGPARLAGVDLMTVSRLAVITTVGSGTDCVDVRNATSARIPVSSGGGVAPVPVAEYVIGAMVIGHRSLLAQSTRLLAGGFDDWEDRFVGIPGRTLAGSKLGLVGYGNIARLVAQRATVGLGVETRYFARRSGQPDELGLEPARSLDELFAWSDTVSVHVPLTQETLGLVGRRQLELLGPDGLLIDTSRAGVTVFDDLLVALKGRVIKAAVMDVVSPEPPSQPDLERLALPNLVVTPHIAGVTKDSAAELSWSAVSRTLDALAGRRPSTLVNPEIWDVRRRPRGHP
jgi:phosphoglycerate dehydrogenase-like enzyme